jgi:enolase
LKDEIHALDIIMEAIQGAGHEGKIDIGLDVAASEFWEKDNKKYNMS